jgi:hypothetical protein
MWLGFCITPTVKRRRAMDASKKTGAQKSPARAGRFWVVG